MATRTDPTMQSALIGLLLSLTWNESIGHATRLPEDEIEALRAEAVAGDADVSLRLADYFGQLETGGFEDHLFFLRLAAEQGNCLALSDYARFQRSPATPEVYKGGGDWDERWKRHCLPEPPDDPEKSADDLDGPGD